MDKMARFRTAGFVIALAGLLIAATSLFFGKEQFPWTLFVGSFIYLHGGFLVLISSRGPTQKEHLGKLRLIRLGFVAVFGLLVWQFFAP